MYAYKDILELAGLTTRIYTMLSTLHHLRALPEPDRDEDKIEFRDAVIGIPKRDSRLGETALVGNAEEGFDFADGSEPIDASHSERPLVRDLNIRIEKGEHLMISGPVRLKHALLVFLVIKSNFSLQNGVGKTAIARVLAGLWAVEDGKVIRPGPGFSKVFVVPQRAYMVTGSLLDQFVLQYPFAIESHPEVSNPQDHLSTLLRTVPNI